MRKSLCLAAFGAQVLVSAGCSTAQDVYAYRPLFEEYGGFQIDPSRKALDYGHLTEKITECRLTDKFACVLGGGQDFAIPRSQSGRSQQDVWEYGDFKYKVVGQFEGTVLGENSSFLIIDRIPKAEYLEGAVTKRFVYEFRRGVVAIANITRERNTVPDADVMLPDLRDVLILKGSTGMAAQAQSTD